MDGICARISIRSANRRADTGHSDNGVQMALGAGHGIHNRHDGGGVQLRLVLKGLLKFSRLLVHASRDGLQGHLCPATYVWTHRAHFRIALAWRRQIVVVQLQPAPANRQHPSVIIAAGFCSGGRSVMGGHRVYNGTIRHLQKIQAEQKGLVI